METLAFSELVEINPRIGIERGKEYPFIEMGTVEPERRYVQTYKNRIFKGSGAKFIVGDQRADLKSIVDLEVPVPPLPTQRKIAAILSAYDDLIENNLQRIKILEEMAQNFYREWFVKFRFPGYEEVRFVDSPLGRVPEGWEVKTTAVFEHVYDAYYGAGQSIYVA